MTKGFSTGLGSGEVDLAGDGYPSSKYLMALIYIVEGSLILLDQW